MKRLMFGVLVLAASASVVAQDKVSKAEICKQVSDMAEAIMEARQNGAQMSKLMEIDTGMPTHDKVARQFIPEAYKQPLMLTEDGKKRSITEFANKAYLDCHEAR